MQTGTTTVSHDAEHPERGRLRPTVLVVDDSRFVRATIARALSGGFDLQQADCGERAWELLLLDPSIGVVLSDLTMPGMDGFELLRRVRESVLPRIRTLPFAVLSGADEPAQRKRAADLGADQFLVKGDGFDGLSDWIGSRMRAAAQRSSGSVDEASEVGAVDEVGAVADACAPNAQVAGAIAELRPALAAETAAHEAEVVSAPAEPAPVHAQPAAERTEPAAAKPEPAGAQDEPAAAHAEPAAERTELSAPQAEPAGAQDEPAAASVTAPSPSIAQPQSSVQVEQNAASIPVETAVLPIADRVVPDPLPRWFQHQLLGLAADAAAPVLIRLHAPDFEDLPSRLRRGVRAADALHQEGPDTAWLFVTAAAPIALKLALRFGLLAAGRAAGEPGNSAVALVSMLPVDLKDPGAALVGLQALPARVPPPGNLAVECAAGVWGEHWRFDVPWVAARLLIG